MDSEHFNFEREWDNYIEKLELSISERFFLDKLKTNLENKLPISVEKFLEKGSILNI